MPWCRSRLAALVGDSHDYALAETINGLYKAELIHRRAPWKTREALELATLEWVSWFNHRRLLGPIGYIPPAEAEANYWRQQEEQRRVVPSPKTATVRRGRWPMVLWRVLAMIQSSPNRWMAGLRRRK